MKENNWSLNKSARTVRGYIAQGTRLLQLCMGGMTTVEACLP